MGVGGSIGGLGILVGRRVGFVRPGVVDHMIHRKADGTAGVERRTEQWRFWQGCVLMETW